VTRDRLLQTQLVAGRVLVGGGALVAPRLAGRLFGIDAAANPAASYVARLFGVRAVLMAVQLATATPANRTHLLRQHTAVDLVDAVAAAVAAREGALSRRAGVQATAAAVLEASLGLRLLAQWSAADRSSSPRR
jgi:hypothetical protein